MESFYRIVIFLALSATLSAAPLQPNRFTTNADGVPIDGGVLANIPLSGLTNIPGNSGEILTVTGTGSIAPSNFLIGSNLTTYSTNVISIGNTNPSAANQFIENSGNNRVGTGANNTAMGSSSLGNLTNGSYNAAFGYSALPNNTSGQYNTAEGAYALDSVSTGSYNVAVGGNALHQITTSGNNVAIGFSSLYNQFSTSTGSNVSIGSAALYNDVFGSSNTAVGNGALINSGNGTGNGGSNNIAIGAASGSAIQNDESSNIYIGNLGSPGDQNITRIGTNQTTAYISGVITGSGFSSGATNITTSITAVSWTNTNGMNGYLFPQGAVSAFTNVAIYNNTSNLEYGPLTETNVPLPIQKGGYVTNNGGTFKFGAF